MQLSDHKDRQDVAEAALKALHAMELSGRMDPGVVKPLQISCKKITYGSQGWEGDNEDEQEVLPLQPDKTSAGRFSRVMDTALSTSSTVT